MNKFYIENKDDLRVLIVNTARNKNISEAVIEKDYWVTFILDYLFNENKWREYFTFEWKNKSGYDLWCELRTKCLFPGYSSKSRVLKQRFENGYTWRFNWNC